MESVQTVTPQSAMPADVLHNEHHSALTAEEIAKAIAHHKRHHHDDVAQATSPGAKKPQKKH
ncbi:MAG: hypothetical protein P4L03_06750 [Terracidiphilus sp.]|nr:hypothetical protein [Terracidiphilus sp.]